MIGCTCGRMSPWLTAIANSSAIVLMLRPVSPSKTTIWPAPPAFAWYIAASARVRSSSGWSPAPPIATPMLAETARSPTLVSNDVRPMASRTRSASGIASSARLTPSRRIPNSSPPQTRHRVGVAHGHGHAVGERAQHLVADRVPERVVDVLHRVDVDEHDTDALVVASGVAERDTNPIVEHRALRQTGEVVTAEVLGRHGALVRFDLAAVRDESGDLAERSDLGHDRQRHREQVARRGEDRNVAVPRTVTQQRRADLVVVAREDLRREQVGSREALDVADAEALAAPPRSGTGPDYVRQRRRRDPRFARCT